MVVVAVWRLANPRRKHAAAYEFERAGTVEQVILSAAYLTRDDSEANAAMRRRNDSTSDREDNSR
jgi:hypothetical protein